MAIEHVVTAGFPPHPAAVPQARRLVRAALRTLHAESAGDHAAELLLAASELATNAVRHARTNFTIRVLANPSRIRLEVTDASSRLPRRVATSPDATCGRGLALIEGMGLPRGAHRRPAGKTVWVEVPRSP